MLADFAQVGKATIQRAERGEPLRLDTIRQLCDFFSQYYHRQVEPEELGLGVSFWESDQLDKQETYSETLTVEEEERTEEQEEMMHRREAIRKLGNIGLALAVAPHYLLEASLSEQYTKKVTIPEIDEETWTHFEQLIETCWHLSKGNVLEIVEPTLWAYLPKIATIAAHSAKQQHIAATIASQGYLLAAILAGHRDDLQERQNHCERALSFGNIAGDQNL